MTKKDLYKLSVKLSSEVLVKFFGAPDGSFKDMESNAARKAARKHAYETLAPYLLTDTPKP